MSGHRRGPSESRAPSIGVARRLLPLERQDRGDIQLREARVIRRVDQLAVGKRRPHVTAGKRRAHRLHGVQPCPNGPVPVGVEVRIDVVAAEIDQDLCQDRNGEIDVRLAMCRGLEFRYCAVPRFTRYGASNAPVLAGALMTPSMKSFAWCTDIEGAGRIAP